MSSLIQNSRPVLVGHPFILIGMGEVVRSSFRAFQRVGIDVLLRDVYGAKSLINEDFKGEFKGHLVSKLSEAINIFCINGNEVSPTLDRVMNELPAGAYNIIYPFWELSIYPHEWAVELDRFDEVWTASEFVFNAVSKSVTKPVLHMPLATEVGISSFFGRRYFGIPESAYAFLFFFDFTSFIDRKNPFAVLKAFERFCEILPDEDVCLVMKTNSSASRPQHFARFEEALSKFRYRDRLTVINKTLTDNEIVNLVYCCDSFISLHRSEGFGRGMAEAMCLGKPVIATGYSGNLDFMDESNSCLVSYNLIPVEEEQYLYAKGQVWADPDIGQAASYMRRLVTDRQYGRKLGEVASRHIRTFFNYGAVGLKYASRIEEILKKRMPRGAK